MPLIRTIADLRARIPDPAPVTAAKIRDHLDDQALAFVAGSPFVILATSGDASLELSPKGDEAGFVQAPDPWTLLLPERRGNQLALGLQNILADPRVGIMVVRPNAAEVLRITGRAELLDDPELCGMLSARGQPALLAIRIHVERAYFHCTRSVLRAGLWKPESWLRPMRVSFGRIYADVLDDETVGNHIDKNAARHELDL